MANEEHVALLKQGWAAAIGLMALGLMKPQVMTTDELLTLRNVLALRRRALLDRLATDTGESSNRPTSPARRYPHRHRGGRC